MKKILLIIVIIAIIVAILAGIVVFATQNKEEKSLMTKSEQQIAYLEDKIITMMNYLNHIRFSNTIVVEQNVDNNSESSQQNKQSSEGSSGDSSSSLQQNGQDSSQSQESSGSENKQEATSAEDNIQYNVKNNSILTNQNQEIDWNYMKNNIEMIYSTWPSMVVDLHELNVKNEDILNFTTVLDQVTLSIKQEDKAVTLNNLASLYALLPNYRSQISQDTDSINIDYTKTSLLNSYAFIEQDKWEEVKVQLQQAIYYFSNVMNRIEGNGQKQSHISKIYVSLNELNSTVENRDKELFYIKYRNAMEELIHF